MPPPGFVFLKRFETHSGSNPTNESKVNDHVALPENTKIDRAYQQTGPLATSGGGAQSPLSSADVPKGFFIEPSGSDTHGKRWAVLRPYQDGDVFPPILSAVAFNDDDSVRQWKFELGLYADTGTAEFQGGATTICDVYYKPRT